MGGEGQAGDRKADGRASAWYAEVFVPLLRRPCGYHGEVHLRCPGGQARPGEVRDREVQRPLREHAGPAVRALPKWKPRLSSWVRQVRAAMPALVRASAPPEMARKAAPCRPLCG